MLQEGLITKQVEEEYWVTDIRFVRHVVGLHIRALGPVAGMVP